MDESAYSYLGDVQKGLWWYAISKLVDEAFSTAYLREKDARILIIRPFNVVSPLQVDYTGFVIPRFVKNALSGEDLVVYGDDSQNTC